MSDLERFELADGWHLHRVWVGDHFEWIICDPVGDRLGGTLKHMAELDSALIGALKRESQENKMAEISKLEPPTVRDPEPWKRCPSTHCERRGECASPHECCVKPKPARFYEEVRTKGDLRDFKTGDLHLNREPTR